MTLTATPPSRHASGDSWLDPLWRSRLEPLLAAGHAELRGDRISTIVLVRSTLEPGKGPMDPQCWVD